MPAPSDEPAGGRSLRGVLIAWLLLSALTQLPYARAALVPPAGRTFVGFFLFVDDSYNYLSFVQQAESGRILFQNKLVLTPHEPALVNLEWWLVGRLSSLIGGHPLIAYRIVGALAALLLLWVANQWLLRLGLPEPHQLPALLLIACAGGLGGIARILHALPFTDCIDLGAGLFPFIEFLMSPHFVVATGLLLWALLAFVEGRTLVALLLGSALAIVRPYDFVLLVVIRAVGILLTQPRRVWLRTSVPLLAFAPAVAYNYWLFYRNPAFTTFQANNILIFPPWYSFVIALGPAAALSGTLWNPPMGAPRRYLMHLLAWLGAALLLILAPPVHFALQFLVGVGIPLLLLAALGLSRFPPRWTLFATFAMSTTGLVALACTLGQSSEAGGADTPLPAHWFAGADAFQIATALAPACRQGDVVVAGGDINLYIGGLSSCRAYSSHANEPDHARRNETLHWFYGSTTRPEERANFLDSVCARFVLLPRRVSPTLFLSRAPVETSAESGPLAVYRWPVPTRCAPQPDSQPPR